MPIVKEFREFFVRNTKVSTGTKPDQESNYPVTYVVNGVTKFNRFLKDHFPTKGIYEKLFESITFKLNKEDTAKTTEQGLAKIASDANAISGTSNASNDYTAVVVPHQLPDVVLTDDAINDTLISTSSVGILTLKKVSRVIGTFARKTYVLTVNNVLQRKYLRADFVKTNSVALAPITSGGSSLNATVEAGKYYSFEAVLFLTCGLGGLKYALSGSATFTEIVAIVEHSNTATDTVSVKGKFNALNVGIGQDGAGAPGAGLTLIKGSMLALTSGSFELHFAQNNSSANASTVLKGSYFITQEML